MAYQQEIICKAYLPFIANIQLRILQGAREDDIEASVWFERIACSDVQLESMFDHLHLDLNGGVSVPGNSCLPARVAKEGNGIAIVKEAHGITVEFCEPCVRID